LIAKDAREVVWLCVSGLFEQEIVMKAVILKETRKIVAGEVLDAEMRERTDVLPGLTSTAICGTDLHFYERRMRGLLRHL
jgi:hypothetical protein